MTLQMASGKSPLTLLAAPTAAADDFVALMAETPARLPNVVGTCRLTVTLAWSIPVALRLPDLSTHVRSTVTSIWLLVDLRPNGPLASACFFAVVRASPPSEASSWAQVE